MTARNRPLKGAVPCGSAYLFMKKKLTIYYAGNPVLAEDAAPFRLVPELEKKFPDIEFKHHDPAENLPERPSGHAEYDLVVIDTVINTDKVISITDEKQLAVQPVYTPHDWDLALNLKLLLKLGKIKSFLIIGLPPNGGGQKIIDSIAEKISEIIQ